MFCGHTLFLLQLSILITTIVLCLNGNVLIISYELKTQAELAAAGGTNTALTSIWPEKGY